MALFQRVMEHNPNDTHWVPNGFPSILEWHFLFGGGLVKTSQDAARLLRRSEGVALYELNAIADIHRMLMEPGGALITTKGKATIKHILQDKACAAMTLALNGLEEGVTAFLSTPRRDGVTKAMNDRAFASSKDGIFSFEHASAGRTRHQQEKLDILAGTDGWKRERVFDAIVMDTMRNQEGKMILIKPFIDHYVSTLHEGVIDYEFEDDQVRKWPKIKSLADTVLDRICDNRMSIDTAWNADNMRFTTTRVWSFEGVEYSTDYARALITAYRQINKTLTILEHLFGQKGQLENRDYRLSILLETMELLSAVVHEADVTNPIIHAVGISKGAVRSNLPMNKM